MQDMNTISYKLRVLVSSSQHAKNGDGDVSKKGEEDNHSKFHLCKTLNQICEEFNELDYVTEEKCLVYSLCMINILFYFMHFCPRMMTTQAESINLDLHTVGDIRSIEHRTEPDPSHGGANSPGRFTYYTVSDELYTTTMMTSREFTRLNVHLKRHI